MQFTVGRGLPACYSGSFQEDKLQYANSETLLMIENKASFSQRPFNVLKANVSPEASDTKGLAHLRTQSG